jgi:hypothetical protein
MIKIIAVLDKDTIKIRNKAKQNTLELIETHRQQKRSPMDFFLTQTGITISYDDSVQIHYRADNRRRYEDLST